MTKFSIAYLLAAIGFFLFGLRLVQTNLRQVSGDRLRVQIGRLTKRRLSAFLLGVGMTVVLQHSAATVVMIVGLAGMSYISLPQAIAVTLGADVGTTLIVFLLAAFFQFSSGQVDLIFVALAFFFYFTFRKGQTQFYARAFLGVALMLYGMGQISAASQPLRQSVLVAQIISAAADNPVVAVFFATLFTILLQSSVAMIGVLLTFAGAGAMTLDQALPFVLGANLGTTLVPFLAGLRAKTDGRRLAYIHVLLKVVAVALFLPFLTSVGGEIARWVETPTYQVATFHLVLNLALAVAFLPLCRAVSVLAVRLIRPSEAEHTFSAKYLDADALESPTLAFANVFREILRMAEITQKMCVQTLLPFEEAGTDTVERLEGMDDQVDHLDRDIKFYLAKLSQSRLTDDQSKRQQELLMLTHDLEQVGDVITKEMMELAEKKRRKNVSFSIEGWAEIKDFHQKVMENFHLAINAFASGDMELAQKVIRHKKKLGEIEQELGQKHLRRLHQGLRESFDTSSIHLDILSNLRRINAIITKMAYPVLSRPQIEANH
ncbi:MAG: Na/Pi cotransporter family protein [Pseudomonadota bacterium]